MAKPVYFIVAGAWHTTACMELLLTKLHSRGVEVTAIQNLSVGTGRPVKTFHDDTQQVHDMVEKECNAGRDVIVIGHSYGGSVVGSALDGLGKKERQAQGLNGGVIKIGFMTAFVVPKGLSLVEVFGMPKRSYPSLWELIPPDNITMMPKNPAKAFYSDLEPAEQEHWISLLVPQALEVNWAEATGEAWMNIPSGYLLCEDDQGLPAELQQGWIDAARKAGADMTMRKVKASHSPFLSKPDEVADWMIDLANGA